MNRPSNGLSSNDPFFDRMLDERIATLRAFIKMSAAKYQIPEQCPPTMPAEQDDISLPTSNVIELRHKRR